MRLDRDPHRYALLALRAVRPVDIPPRAPKAVPDQLVIGIHVHVHMGIGESADRFPVLQITAGLGSGSKKVEFCLVVHRFQMQIRYLILDPKCRLVTPPVGFFQAADERFDSARERKKLEAVAVDLRGQRLGRLATMAGDLVQDVRQM